MRHHSRRSFLKKSAFATAAAPLIVPASALGKGGRDAPSERVNVGVIACGSRASAAGAYNHGSASQIAAICDPIRDRRLKKKGKWGNPPDFSDFREVLARKDIDAVHIATADHWHVPISLAAAKAGKHMYTEKPLGVSIEQDLAARRIAREYDRVFQYGTQNRSMSQVRMGTELVLNGHIGEVKAVYVWCPPGHGGGSPTPVLPVPAGYDYDMWLGPAPKRPFCRDRCVAQGARNGIFHIYDYAIGFMAGWGAHPMDQLQWWADSVGRGIPVEYSGTGTIPTKGLFNTITNWDVTCTYADGLKLRFTDNKTARGPNKIPHIDEMKFGHAALYEGTKGWVAVSRGAWKVFPDTLYQKAKNPGSVRLANSRNHAGNFIDAVRKRAKTVTSLESAVLSDIICHLSDIAVRTRRTIRWDPKRETIVGDAAAAKMMSKPMRAPWSLNP